MDRGKDAWSWSIPMSNDAVHIDDKCSSNSYRGSPVNIRLGQMGV